MDMGSKAEELHDNINGALLTQGFSHQLDDAAWAYWQMNRWDMDELE